MLPLLASNSNLLSYVILGSVVTILALILRYFKQPYIIAYIVAGVLLGKHGFEIITDEASITVLGDIGLILLMFFIGMEISLVDLLENWKTPTIGTLVQVFASISIVAILGYYLSWPSSRTIFFGFVISLSSSAVVIKLLQDNNESNSDIGQSVISVLIIQDILIVPMMIIVNYLGGKSPTVQSVLLQVIGGVILVGTIIWIARKKEFTLPFGKYIEHDHELQVFGALITCFGFAVITEGFGLSAALGAFVAGLIVHAAKSTEWFHDSLHSFRIIFVAIFFVSIGMLIDLHFFYEHWKVIIGLIVAVYITNHFINGAILHYFGRDWVKSLYGGALLAQVGELSFILTSTASKENIITEFGYQTTVIMISLTLLISPFWILATKTILTKFSKAQAT